MNAEKTITNILTTSADHTADLRMVRTMAIGQWVRQGDVNIERVADDYPRGDRITDRQLAPGTTKGSRHIVGGEAAEIYAPAKVDPLVGPVIWSPERYPVGHPEHSDVSLPSGTYRVTFPRDHAQEERARVMD